MGDFHPLPEKSATRGSALKEERGSPRSIAKWCNAGPYRRAALNKDHRKRAPIFFELEKTYAFSGAYLICPLCPPTANLQTPIRGGGSYL
jgi:hypothetical protein